MTEASLVLLGQSLAASATFFALATLAFLYLLVVQPTSDRALQSVDPVHQPTRKGAAPSQAPLQRVDQVVDLARGAGLRDEASGRQNVAAAGVR